MMSKNPKRRRNMRLRDDSCLKFKMKENMLDDGSEIKKARLLSEKHDSLPKESLFECSDCQATVHQICALINGRKAGSKSDFRCPKCVLLRRHTEPNRNCEAAKELPKCKMSNFLEEGLQKVLGKAYKTRSLELGIDISEVEKVEGLCVRVVSHVKKKHAVRDEASTLQIAFLYPNCV